MVHVTCPAFSDCPSVSKRCPDALNPTDAFQRPPGIGIRACRINASRKRFTNTWINLLVSSLGMRRMPITAVAFGLAASLTWPLVLVAPDVSASLQYFPSVLVSSKFSDHHSPRPVDDHATRTRVLSVWARLNPSWIHQCRPLTSLAFGRVASLAVALRLAPRGLGKPWANRTQKCLHDIRIRRTPSFTTQKHR